MTARSNRWWRHRARVRCRTSGEPTVRSRDRFEPQALPEGGSAAPSDRNRSRRSFLAASGALVAAATGGEIVAAALGLPHSASAGSSSTHAESATHPIRPPAVPLAVRGPYLSAWLPGTELPGTWPTFWTGRPTEMAGIVMIDGVPFVFAGAPAVTIEGIRGSSGHPRRVDRMLRQTLLEVTPTRSRFHLEGGGLRLIVEFLSPVEPGNLRAQSIPMSYLLLTVASIDLKPHEVQIYLDVSSDWAGAGPGAISSVPTRVSSADGDLQAWAVQPSEQRPLTEQGQQAAWGTVIWAAPRITGLTFQSGRDSLIRGEFVRRARLAPGKDAGRRQSVGDDRQVFAFSMDLGRISSSPRTVPLVIGHVRTPAVRYLGRDLPPLWTKYFPTWRDMLGFFGSDVNAARRRADELDSRITADAK
ncbi:MAG TPA: DUF5127 domain-containing protein, partial [Streptosporangiaceae bacterium]|nr:DUF5127 domain-containing protein [Streptosporangiaceae bacterium]